MKKIIYVTPHLSTGGLPQYLLKKIETFNNDYEIWCIEWSNYSDEYVVQKNRIKSLLGQKLISLNNDKNKFLELIDNIQPDIIHFEEIPESFISESILNQIYVESRKFHILVTTHSSQTRPETIKYTADKFILVSDWSKEVFTNYYKEEIHCDIWEYPIEKKEINKSNAKIKLGFDPNYKHVLNVGLFTPGKNQGELIELAKKLNDYPIKFHFVGNQAINFKHYWEPLMKDLPNNCIIHGEKSNVNDYLEAADAFYFTSNFELNPLVVKESLSYNLTTFIKKLETYGDNYDGLVHYITNDQEQNKSNLLSSLSLETIDKNDSIAIVLAHANTNWRKHLLKNCLSSLSIPVILSTNYPISEDLQHLCHHYIYDKNNPLLHKEDFAKYGVVYNFTKTENDKIIHKSFDYEHSYAVYCLIKNGIQTAHNLGYQKVHIINYDYEISRKIIDENTKILNEKDLVVYQYREEYESSFSSGFFSCKIESIINFFTKYLSIDEFYEKFEFFENRLSNYIKTHNTNVQINSFDYLSSNCKTNQEGLLEFSKSDTFTEQQTLTSISNKFNCDKSTSHQYDLIYPTFIEKFRHEDISILEIGIDEGKSYKVWSEYFTKAKIWGMDIDKEYTTERGRVFRGNQYNKTDLDNLINHIKQSSNNCKLIIDDASHIAEHQLFTFDFLFKNLLKPGGVYIIEDTECSYWNPEKIIYGNKTGYLNIIDYFTKLNHEVNWRYNGKKNELDINTITFGPNCIIITKIDYPRRDSFQLND